MQLFYRSYGKGFPIVALHGLYASSDSWIGLANELSNHYQVILVDQRNHGRSPHSPEHTYEQLSNDLHMLLDSLSLKQVILMGHSMGGKTAMYFALRHPERVKGLIVEDVSPLAYPSNHENALYHKKIIHSLQSLPINSCQSRRELENILFQTISDMKLCKFLLKNLQRTKDGKFVWRINLDILLNNLLNILDEVTLSCTAIKTPSLFIKGSMSKYVEKKDETAIQNYFPNASIVTIQNVGHWVHTEQQNEFLRNVNQYLSLLNNAD